MSKKYAEYKGLNLTEIARSIAKLWSEEKTFEKSLQLRENAPAYVFYEGPPSANGQPGIHHVMARAIKDIFCRYKTLKGYRVDRKAGWDTHGLPVELGVEKNLGIIKEDIGKTISVEEYNRQCRAEVMKYKDLWDKLTIEMGYWVDLDNPYITFDNKYIETLWWLLKQLYDKGLLYKGYTIQPYSPAAGTGLSSHELNQPGCYRDVKDTTVVGQFKVVRNEKSEFLFQNVNTPLYILAWTTTPWTLPSNTALAVGAKIQYVKVRSFNQYTGEPITVILAKNLLNIWFDQKNAELLLEEYQSGDKKIPYKILNEYSGNELVNVEYEQLLPWIKPMGDAFRVILGDYVTTDDGTGIVHIAPTFGADDDRVAKHAGIVPLILIDKEKKCQPMVDRTGKFFNISDLDEDFIKNHVNTSQYQDFAGKFVKKEYDPLYSYVPQKDKPKSELDKLLTTDITADWDLEICLLLKRQGLAFKIEKYVHNYPHCWRTDKPVLYYPLDSWFVKTTAFKERIIELNKTINWKPQTTGTGRFGNWLENMVDWNLSRSRYWGTPLPIWRTEDGKEELCIGSVAQLKDEIEKSIQAGFMKQNPLHDFVADDNSNKNYETFDLHRPYVDNIILVSPSGRKMIRESDLIDVWFDSGAMPYAQFHYPFENASNLNGFFPADFIAEGVDQTRGWFYTLHVIAAMVFDNVSFKNCVSNGLVLDKNGNKMSKRMGNAIDPFETMEKFGPDALRWYMITNAQPWDNLKFDINGVDEVRRKFFGTLYNTYSFFALYANIDGFCYQETDFPIAKRPEIDRWILSELNTLIHNVDKYYTDYEPTQAGRAIFDFVNDYLSNWYVRLCRRRFWHGEYTEDKISAYQTLYTCLEVVAQLMSPIAPFYSDCLFRDLNSVTQRHHVESVHLTTMPVYSKKLIDKELETRMQLAQKICSLTLSLRKKNNIRVRQPLEKIMIPISGKEQEEQIKAVEHLILSEVNIKSIEYLTESSNKLVKKIKPNFKVLGPKYGQMMKSIAGVVTTMDQHTIVELEYHNEFQINVDNQQITLTLEDVEITTEDIAGWVVASEGFLTVALDIVITDPLYQEGIARDMVNRIQNMRKESGLEVTDRIRLIVEKQDKLYDAINNNITYICRETLMDDLVWQDTIQDDDTQTVDISDDIIVKMKIETINNK